MYLTKATSFVTHLFVPFISTFFAFLLASALVIFVIASVGRCGCHSFTKATGSRTLLSPLIAFILLGLATVFFWTCVRNMWCHPLAETTTLLTTLGMFLTVVNSLIRTKLLFSIYVIVISAEPLLFLLFCFILV